MPKSINLSWKADRSTLQTLTGTSMALFPRSATTAVTPRTANSGYEIADTGYPVFISGEDGMQPLDQARDQTIGFGCTICHVLPIGTNSLHRGPPTNDQQYIVKVPQLRNLYRKDGASLEGGTGTAHSRNRTTGYTHSVCRPR